MQRYALLVCVSLMMCCIGFLFRSEAHDADAFILGQKLVYAFVTHGMFLMVLFILEYCNFSMPKFLTVIFHTLNFIVSFCVLSLDHHPFFYKKYWAVQKGGYIILEKEYGFMHTVAVGLFVLYMIFAIIITVEFTIKNIHKRTVYAWRVLIAAMIPCISYAVSKLADMNNDIQPLSFAAFTFMVIYMIYKNNLYDIDNIAAKFSIAAVDEAIVVLDNNNLYKGCNGFAQSLFPSLVGLNLDCKLSDTAPDVAKFISGNINEYECDKKVYSVTVNPIRVGIAEGKVIKFDDITIQRKYTTLLEAQKLSLESEIKTLSDYSYKDGLTGLKNRRSFEEMVDNIRKSGSVDDVVVGLCDLNGLKIINDNLCHAAGDEMIKATADILSEVFSKYGQVFRIGGDEFCVILTTLPKDLEKLESEFKKKAAAFKGEYIKGFSISTGFVFGKNYKDITIDKLLIKSDEVMYKNKQEHYRQRQIELYTDGY